MSNNLDMIINKHNKLCSEIMAYIMRGEEPPRSLCIEYYNNFKSNIDKHIKSSELSMTIGGLTL